MRAVLQAVLALVVSAILVFLACRAPTATAPTATAPTATAPTATAPTATVTTTPKLAAAGNFAYPVGPAGGVLSGTYPNPTFAADSGLAPTVWGSDLAGSTNSAQYVAGISGHAGGGGAVPLVGAHIVGPTDWSDAGIAVIVSADTDAGIAEPVLESDNLGDLVLTAPQRTLYLGTAPATGVSIGHGSPYTVTVNGGLTQYNGGFSITGNATSTITSSGVSNVVVDSNAILELGPTTATSIVAGNASTTTALTLKVKSGDPIEHVVGSSTALLQELGGSDFIDLGTGGTGLQLEPNSIDSSGAISVGPSMATAILVGNSSTTAAMTFTTESGDQFAVVNGSTAMAHIAGATTDFWGFDASFGSTGYLRFPSGAQVLLAANSGTLLDTASGGATEIHSYIAGSGGGINLWDTSTELVSLYNASSTVDAVVPAAETGGLSISTTKPTGTGSTVGPSITLTAANGQNVSSGTDNSGGSVVVSTGVPGTGGTANSGDYGALEVVGGSDNVWIGSYAVSGAANSGYGAIWFDTSSPGSTNFGFLGSQATTWLNVPSGGTLELTVALTAIETLNSSSVTFGVAPVEYASAVTSPTISQIVAGNAATPQALSIKAQYPGASCGSSAECTPGNLNLEVGAPGATGSPTEGFVNVVRNGTAVLAMGADPGTSGGDIAFWFGSSAAAPTGSNYSFLGNASQMDLVASSYIITQVSGIEMVLDGPNAMLGVEVGTAALGSSTYPWNGISLKNNVSFTGTTSNPAISQNTTSSGNGTSLSLNAQQCTGSTCTGGTLDLNAGGGTSTNGTIQFGYTGTVTAVLTPTIFGPNSAEGLGLATSSNPWGTTYIEGLSITSSGAGGSSAGSGTPWAWQQTSSVSLGTGTSGCSGSPVTLTAAQMSTPVIQLTGTGAFTTVGCVVLPNAAGFWIFDISGLSSDLSTDGLQFQSGSATSSVITSSLTAQTQLAIVVTRGSNTVSILN